MKQQEVFKKMGTILKELNDQYDYLNSEHENHLNDLELELFVANAHFLWDHSEVLRKLNQQIVPAPAAVSTTVTEEPAKKTGERFFEPVVQLVKPEAEAPQTPVKENQVEDKPVPHIDLTANGADDDFSVVRHEEPEVIRHELELNEADVWEDDDDTGFEIDEPLAYEEEIPEKPPVKEAEPIKETPVAEVKKEARPVEHKKVPEPENAKTETDTEEPMTINQRIMAQMNKAGKGSEHLHSQPITDLKQAINLNDKLSYIKDLFNGYNLAYSEAIDILNRFSSFKEAEDFLKSNYAVKNHWDTKQATADKFYELLRRRYA
ncbi:MAG: hypothetical protein ACXVJB_09165 [Mucilaginibacter sp.]